MKNNHDGDCTIYASLCNGNCWDGICTCGYGLDYLRDSGGSEEHLISNERKEKLPKVSDEDIEKFNELIRNIFNGKEMFIDKAG